MINITLFRETFIRTTNMFGNIEIHIYEKFKLYNNSSYILKWKAKAL